MNRAARRRAERVAPAKRPALARTIAMAASIVALAVIAVVALLNARAVSGAQSQAPIYAPLNKGDVAPHFAVTTITGQSVDSAAISTPIALELFATWCPHCQAETAALNALERATHGRLAIVAVSASDIAADRQSPASLDDVVGFARQYKVAYPIAYDPKLDVAKAYLQGGFPTIVFIDAHKRVTSIETGEVTVSRLVADAAAAVR